MPRFAKGTSRTGKKSIKKEPKAAAEEPGPQTDEQPKRCHKKKPTPYEKVQQERQARTAAWLSSEVGQEQSKHPKGQDKCDCLLGERTRKYSHDLFCPIVACFAFDIDCCTPEKKFK
jgi:hypothetical protein